MAIYTAQLGPKRPSDLAGLRQISERNYDRGLKERALGMQEQSLGLQQDNSEMAARATLAKAKTKQQSADLKYAQKAVSDYSLYMASKSPQEQEMFKQTDQYKELQKLIKRSMPEYVDDRGDIVIIPKREIYASHIESLKSHFADKLKSGQQITDRDAQAMRFLNNTDSREVAFAISNATDDVNYLGASSKEKQAIVRQYLQLQRASTYPQKSTRPDRLHILDNVGGGR